MNRIQTLAMTVLANLVVAVSVAAQLTALVVLTLGRLELPTDDGAPAMATAA